jgi:hypothetical protein
MRNINNYTRAILLVIISFLLTAGVCEMVPSSDPIDLKDIPGVYEANYNAGLVDKIELRPDSIYIHYFESKDGHKYIDSGKYWYRYGRDNDSINVSITLWNFINRFTVNPNDNDVFSTANNAIYDSIPHHLSTVLFKEDDEIRIHRQTFGQKYIKKLKK